MFWVYEGGQGDHSSRVAWQVHKKIAKFLRSYPGGAGDSPHRVCVYRIMSWNNHKAAAVCHNDVLSLPKNVKTGSLKCLYGPQVSDPGNFRRVLDRDVHFSQDLLGGKLSGGFQVFSNRVLNVSHCLFFSGSLRPAAWKPRARNAETLFGWCQCNGVLHNFNSSMLTPNDNFKYVLTFRSQTGAPTRTFDARRCHRGHGDR